MGKIITFKKEQSFDYRIMSVWVAIKFNLEDEFDEHEAWIRGVYSTQKGAIDPIMKEIEEAMDGEEEVPENGLHPEGIRSDYIKIVNAKEHLKKLKKELKEDGECKFVYGYCVEKCLIQE